MKFSKTVLATSVVLLGLVSQVVVASSFATVEPGNLVIGSDIIMIAQPHSIDIQGGSTLFKRASLTPWAHFYPQDCLKGSCSDFIKVKTDFKSPVAPGLTFPNSVTGFYLLFLTAIDKQDLSKGYQAYQELYGIYPITGVKDGKSGLERASYQRRFGVNTNPTKPVEDSSEAITLNGFINYLKFNWEEQFNK